jgi:hypothetical protein
MQPKQQPAGAALRRELHQDLQWIPTAQASALLQPPAATQQAGGQQQQQQQQQQKQQQKQQGMARPGPGGLHGSGRPQQQAQGQVQQQQQQQTASSGPASKTSMADSIDSDYVMISSSMEMAAAPGGSAPGRGATSSSAAGRAAGLDQLQGLRGSTAAAAAAASQQQQQLPATSRQLLAPQQPRLAPTSPLHRDPPQQGDANARLPASPLAITSATHSNAVAGLAAAAGCSSAAPLLLQEAPAMPPSSVEGVWELGVRLLQTLQQLVQQRREAGSLLDCVSLQLFSLRLLQGLAQAAAAMQQQHKEQQQAQLAPSVREVAAQLLADAASTSASAAKMRSSSTATLPSPWALLYGEALAMGRAAGVEELLGNCQASVASYGRSVDLLALLHADVAWLGLDRPPWQPAEQQRLQRYQAQVQVRQAACAAARR